MEPKGQIWGLAAWSSGILCVTSDNFMPGRLLLAADACFIMINFITSAEFCGWAWSWHRHLGTRINPQNLTHSRNSRLPEHIGPKSY